MPLKASILRLFHQLFFITFLFLGLWISGLFSLLHLPGISFGAHIDAFFISSFICVLYLKERYILCIAIVSLWFDVMWQLPFGASALVVGLQYCVALLQRRYGSARGFLYHLAIFLFSYGIVYLPFKALFAGESTTALIFSFCITFAAYPLFFATWVRFFQSFGRGYYVQA